MDILERRLPALAALKKEFALLAPHLSHAGKVLRKLEAQPGEPGAMAAELEGVLRRLRTGGAQLRARGSRRHSDTVLKALAQVETLLTRLMSSAREAVPPVSPPRASPLAEHEEKAIAAPPMRSAQVTPRQEDAERTLPGEPFPGRSVEPPLLWGEGASGPASSAPREVSEPPSPSGLRWSMGALVLASRERASSAPAQLFEELLEAHFEHLADAFDSRLALLSSTSATGEQLAALEARILARTDALRWMGPEAVQELERRLASAEEAGTAFAAALPLLSLEGHESLEAVKRAAKEAAPEIAPGFVEALRFAPHPRLLTALEVLSGPEVPAFLRAPILELRVQYGHWDSSQVQRALASDEPDLVAAAARAVLTAGRVEFVDTLEALLTHELEAPADIAVMVAAAVLGSAFALKRVRLRLAGDAAPSEKLIRLLAAGGTQEDAELLGMLARKKGPVGEVAIWALARLGAPEAIPWLHELMNGAATAEGTAEALRWLERLDRRPSLTGRVARGAAWTVQVPVSVLMSPVAPFPEREWAFWELVARTGLHVPFDVHWPWGRQQRAAKAWEAVVREAPHRFWEGNWLYRGKLYAQRGRA